MQEIGVQAEVPGWVYCLLVQKVLSLLTWLGTASITSPWSCWIKRMQSLPTPPAALMWKDPLGAVSGHGIAVSCPCWTCIYFLSSANTLTLLRILPSVLISDLVVLSRVLSWPRGGPVNPSWSMKHPLFIPRPLCRVAWRLRRLGFSHHSWALSPLSLSVFGCAKHHVGS